MPRGLELESYIRERICELKRSAKWGAKHLKRLKGVSLPRSGAPRMLTAEDRDHVYDAIQNRPDITPEDLLRLTHDMGLQKWRKMNRPYLTPIHAAKRLAWALAYRHFTPEDWKRVLERSGHLLLLKPASRARVWYSNDTLKGKQTKPMFWACFSGAPRKTGLIPLFGDHTADRKGITKKVIHNLYQGILPTFLTNEDAIFSI
ncbi:hypothetical protein N7476_000325 [Penicillium atrosanguineum]|uniref:Transposase Tc1-like domain-containing protein n=1 Tax=Penicillium atrosanguineum TaxID=1132637 RepID=A0A9W9UBJ3_9EURO|nr:hypothetical protein N7476_000325 [Penicillium atrosanguineum]